MARDPADGKTVAGRLALWDEQLLEGFSILNTTRELRMKPSLAEAPTMPGRTEHRRRAEARPRGRFERVAGEA